MKRLVLSLCAVLYALSFTACEPRPVEELPDHYRGEHAKHPSTGAHKTGDKAADPHKTAEPHKDPAPSDPHAKPAAPEKKEH